VPCYNEKDVVVSHIERLYRYLKNKGWNFELIICDDASTDGTSELVDAMRLPELKVFHYKNGPSRRENLSLALQQAAGPILLYMDMDLSTNLENLDDLVAAIESGQYDVVVGSRYQKGAIVKREILRLMYSLMYNTAIRILFRSRILDHQCGFKAFHREVFLQLAVEMGYDEKFSRGWFWDAELLIRAQRKGLRILEMPVQWTRAAKSSFSFVRELKVIPYMLRLKSRLK
jgi:glycosyltransferase involved in cell wall biosynthesis